MSKLIYKFPELISERTLLRKLSINDASHILYLRSNKIVNEYIKRPKMKSVEDAKKYILERNKEVSESKIYYWGIALKSNNQLIGTICLWNLSDDKTYAEIGYELIPEYFNKGIMTEAFKEVILFGIETLKLHKIEAFTHYKNEGSIKLLLKNKFAFQENRKDEGFPDNRIYLLENFS